MKDYARSQTCSNIQEQLLLKAVDEEFHWRENRWNKLLTDGVSDDISGSGKENEKEMKTLSSTRTSMLVSE